MISSDENTYELGLENSDEASDDDERSLLPDEIIVTSGNSDAEESLLNIPCPPDSDISISSDDIGFLQEISSESDKEHDKPLNYKKKLDKYRSYRHYTRLKGHVMRKRLPAPVKLMIYDMILKETFTAADTLDEVASFFYPPDAPVGYFPIVTGSDGNCLLRSLLHLIFGKV